MTYEDLHKDPSGSTQMNRDDWEFCWATIKLFTLYGENDDFALVMESAADVDTRSKGNWEIFQVKTKKKNNFTIGSLLKVPEGKRKSILGTLCEHLICDDVVGCTIVSNSCLRVEGEPQSNYCFSSLSNEMKKTICDALRKEGIGHDVDLGKVTFVRCEVSLDPKMRNTFVNGHVAEILEKSFPKQSIHSIMAASFWKSRIYSLAIKETPLDGLSQSEIIKTKGITKEEMDTYFRLQLEETGKEKPALFKFIDCLGLGWNFSPLLDLKRRTLEYRKRYITEASFKEQIDLLRRSIKDGPGNSRTCVQIVQTPPTTIDYPIACLCDQDKQACICLAQYLEDVSDD